MPTTLNNFLIGIGLDFNTDDVKQVNSGLDSVKRTALQATAAVAGAFGAKAITADTANRVRQYTLLAETISSTADSVYALDRAYQRGGGGAGEIVGQLEHIKTLQAELQVGKAGWIPEATMAGIDTSAIIGEKDPTKVYRNLVGQLEKMSTNSRLNAIKALGLDPTVINLAIDGLREFDKQIKKALERRQITSELQDASEEFQTNWFDMWDNIGGITDRAGGKIIPKVNEITGSFNDFFDANRDAINSGMDTFWGEVADNLGLVAIAAVSLSTSGVAATLGAISKSIPIIGGSAAALASVAKSMGYIGAAYAASSYVAGKIDEQGQKSGTYNKADEALTKWIYDVTGYDASRGGVYEGQDRNTLGDMATGAWDSTKGTFSGIESNLQERMTPRHTVITPSDVSRSLNPLMKNDVASGTQREATQSSRQSTGRKATQIVNNFYVDSRLLKTEIKTVMDEEDEQAIKDLRSPINR